jgi:hypothetical protein
MILSWLVLMAVFVALLVYGIANGLSNSLITEFVALYAIDSAIFFLLFRARPNMGLAMLVLLLVIDICIVGYFALTILVYGSSI